ncbi:lethal(2)neighbour of tid protein 2 [Contarinia nasturtii]|uniref:lethal(2)neighbour of tid protein 2 n=1 Tax=Contarinia nasturtii TaxID=265458 RepID=UPI0012D47F94|nr:lethal(2)neighbour of tid protein 2 [Contarinia nasturtii]
MAPIAKNSHVNAKKSLINFIKSCYKEYVNVNYAKSLLFDPSKLPIVSIGILIVEFMLNIFIVQRVNYTEIDWIAYMQECEGFLNGTTNYSLLKGDTGPLVYPAGFVYIYTFLYYITGHGKNIRLAQYCFICIYLLQMHLVLKIYSKSRKVPPYVLIFSAFTSHRIHSIYVLRLFNDPIAILLLYAALNFYLNGNWTMGSIFLSLGVSVKMNILLFAPAILLFYIVNLGYVNTIKQLSICAVIQLVLGAPFLLTHPIEYIKGSFDFGRIFQHKWTVNYRFLPIETFEHKYFHITLLAVHIMLLLVFLVPSYKYFQNYCRLRTLQAQLQPQIDVKNRENDVNGTATTKKSTKKRKTKDNEDNKQSEEEITINQKIFLNSFEQMLRKSSGAPVPPTATDNDAKMQKYDIHFDRAVQLAILPIFLANFIGIVCARSLHYQFYVWYFHSLPYLSWFTDFNVMLKLLLLGLIEFAWNTYPSTVLSSSLLHLSHLILLYGIGSKLLRIDQDSKRVKIQ